MKQVFFALAVLVSLAGPARPDELSAAFKVVVNARVSGARIGRAALADIFLGRAQRWADGARIVPVDLSSTSAVREAFSLAILGMPVDGVKTHWLRTLSAARRPPVVKTSDWDVIAVVAAEPGSVGYVSVTAPVPAAVREVAVQ